MLVCRQWKRIIEQGPLYDTLSVYTENGFNKLMTKLSHTPSMAHKVNRVPLFLYPEIELNLTHLLSSLPNVQTLFRALQEVGDILLDRDTVFPFLDHIQYISEHYNNAITPKIIQSHLCPNLTYLRVYDSGFDIIPLLKNTPNLISLFSDQPVTSFNTLDTIHKSVPRLQYLKLRKIKIENISLEHADHTPAQTLVECVFGHAMTDNSSTWLNILKYIAMKYTKLSKFEFWLYSTMQLSDVAAANLNENGWAPLFRKLGRQLKKLCLSYDNFKHQLALLDDSDCRVEYLHTDCIFDTTVSQLAVSNQILYIQTLVLHTTNPGSFVWLNQFRMLAKLKIKYNCHLEENHTLSFPDLITYAPSTLKTLSIRQYKLSIDSKYKGLSHSIQKLSLHWTTVPNGIDVFVSRCLPNLSHLKLKSYHMAGKTLNLAKLKLFKFCFTDYLDGEVLNGKIMVLTIGDNEKRWYEIGDQFNVDFIDKHLISHYVPFKRWPVEEVDTEPGFTLICYSLKNIVFH